MAEQPLRRCPDCDGRGYHMCECWPADCIMGCEEPECGRCDGCGFIDPVEEAHWDAMDRHYLAKYREQSDG